MFIPDTNQKNTNKEKGCTHLEHNPPSHWVPQTSGTWKCPSCGQETRIELPTC